MFYFCFLTSYRLLHALLDDIKKNITNFGIVLNVYLFRVIYSSMQYEYTI